jgi:hypothetical protein
MLLKVFNPQTILNLLALVVIFVQMKFGFWIDPYVQVVIIGILNVVARTLIHKDLFPSDTAAPVQAKPDLGSTPLLQSKTMWISVIAILSPIYENVTGHKIPGDQAAMILTLVTSAISMVTHKSLVLR